MSDREEHEQPEPERFRSFNLFVGEPVVQPLESGRWPAHLEALLKKPKPTRYQSAVPDF